MAIAPYASQSNSITRYQSGNNHAITYKQLVLIIRDVSDQVIQSKDFIQYTELHSALENKLHEILEKPEDTYLNPEDQRFVKYLGLLFNDKKEISISITKLLVVGRGSPQHEQPGPYSKQTPLPQALNVVSSQI